MILENNEVKKAKFLVCKIQSIDNTILNLVTQKSAAMVMMNDHMKDLKNKYDFKESYDRLYIDFYTNEVKVKP
jgi:hypothetical protein